MKHKGDEQGELLNFYDCGKGNIEFCYEYYIYDHSERYHDLHLGYEKIPNSILESDDPIQEIKNMIQEKEDKKKVQAEKKKKADKDRRYKIKIEKEIEKEVKDKSEYERLKKKFEN